MKKILTAAGCAAIISITAAAFTWPGPLSRLQEEAARADALRITAHLRTVESELLVRDVSGLSLDQRAARARNIAVLREYREDGIYPHNHDHPEGRLPYFRDQHGTLCAMAYLIWRSGETPLVDRVARTNNSAYIKDLAEDTELIAWLERNGLDVAEAARIQPTYGPTPGESTVSTGYATATALTAVAEGAVIAWNLLATPGKSGRLEPGVLAILTGSVGFALGYSAIGDTDNHDLSGLNLGVGLVTGAVGVVNIARAIRSKARRGSPATESASKSLQVSPTLNTDPRGRAQVGLNLRF